MARKEMVVRVDGSSPDRMRALGENRNLDGGIPMKETRIPNGGMVWGGTVVLDGVMALDGAKMVDWVMAQGGMAQTPGRIQAG